MRFALFCSMLLVTSYQSLFSQKYTINGFVEDPLTGERLIGVNVYEANSLAGTSTNTYGFYSLTLPGDTVRLIFSYIGYEQQEKNFYLNKDTVINFRFEEVEKINEITVHANKTSVERSQMSMIQLKPASIDKLPVLLGERDLIKTLQLLPGVQSGSEGSSHFYVRGGGPDQNLVLLDGVPVYNVNHLFGFFSVFNTDAIQDVSLIKGGFPARYGGRLSSVLDIKLKEGNNQEFKGEGSIGLISSKLTLEGPLIKNKSSFLISGRRTYIDILAQPFISIFNNDIEKLRAGYFFHDLNLKTNYLFSGKDRLFLSLYTGKDKAYTIMRDKWGYDEYLETIEQKSQLWWGNITGALRWNHVFNNRLFSNTTLTYSRYKFLVGDFQNRTTNESSEEYELNYFSGINDLSGKIDFDYSPSPAHSVKFGGNYTHHVFHPGISAFSYKENDESPVDTTLGNVDIPSDEFYFYVEDDINITPKFKTNIGLHYSGFNVNKKFYNSLQPRISLRYKFSNGFAVKAAYSHMSQYIHLLTNSSIGLPTDLWLPVTEKVKPQRSNQYAIGAVYTFNDNNIEISIEGFYKDMHNLIEYKEGASFFSVENDWENKIEIGKGWAYGGEFLIEKKSGKTTGWIGYTLSWSERRFKNISFGEIFPAGYDRRHDISLAVNRQFSDRFDMGVVWVYGTGYPVTLALEKYPYAQNNGSFFGWEILNYIENIESRNNYRMPAYHRLDIGFNFHKKKRWHTRTWSFGVYNAYNRINPFYLYYDYKDTYYYDGFLSSKKVLKQVGLFPLIPFVSYSFKF